MLLHLIGMPDTYCNFDLLRVRLRIGSVSEIGVLNLIIRLSNLEALGTILSMWSGNFVGVNFFLGQCYHILLAKWVLADSVGMDCCLMFTGI